MGSPWELLWCTITNTMLWLWLLLWLLLLLFSNIILSHLLHRGWWHRLDGLRWLEKAEQVLKILPSRKPVNLKSSRRIEIKDKYSIILPHTLCMEYIALCGVVFRRPCWYLCRFRRSTDCWSRFARSGFGDCTVWFTEWRVGFTT